MKPLKERVLNILWRMITFLLDILPSKTTPYYDVRLAERVAILSYGSKVGDSVIMTLFVRNFKRHFPHTHLTVGIQKEYEEIFKNNPNIDSLITLPNSFLELHSLLKKHRWDVILDIPFSDRKNLLAYYFSAPHKLISVQYHAPCKHIAYLKPAERTHFSDIFVQALRLFDIQSPDLSYDLFPSFTDKNYVQTFLSKHQLQNKKFILFNPQASSLSRCLNATAVRSIIDKLKQAKIPTVLLCHQLKYAKALPLDVPIFHTNSIMHTAAIVSTADHILTVDTGVVHIADAYKKPMTVLYSDVCNPGEFPRSAQYLKIWQPKHSRFSFLRALHNVNEISPEEIVGTVTGNWNH